MTPRTEPVPALRLDDDAYLDREYHRTLADEIRASGGQWVGSDHDAKPAAIIAAAVAVGATALRISLRDLTPLQEVPGLWHVDVGSDGAKALGPLQPLTGLRSLNLDVRGIKGEFDPLTLPELRWLKSPLGGTGGAQVLAGLKRGHDRLTHLRVRETKVRSVGELVAALPRLETLSLSYADFLRSPGDLGPVAGTLRELRLDMVPALRSLEGIEVAAGLETVRIWATKVSDLEPLLLLPSLREVDVNLGHGIRLTDLDALRAHVEA